MEKECDKIKYKGKQGSDFTYFKLPDDKGFVSILQQSEDNAEPLVMYVETEKGMKDWLDSFDA